ncbi:hypothetical protein V1L52_06085 [Treponema sp. HNW]|uniref:hypothetical protein n=1 Tax=Treponema sp. HNW TaxID=3116654 RepID=UPI003D102D0D
MNSITERFISEAQNGKTVYINDVRECFAQLKNEKIRRFSLALVTAEGYKRRFDYTIPAFNVPASVQTGKTEKMPAKELEALFIRDYCMAELYNIISCLGARSMKFYTSEKSAEVTYIYNCFIEKFGIFTERAQRKEYGRAVNVAERILDALDMRTDSKIEVDLFDTADMPSDFMYAAKRQNCGFVGEKLKEAVQKSDKGILIGIDVGGTDIKLALSVNGKLTALKEYDWFPAGFTRIHELIDPVIALVDFMRYRADSRFNEITDTAMPVEASDELIIKCTEKAKQFAFENGIELPLYDGIGLSFPDVVVQDSIVGGEVFKTRGIRENPAVDYEKEFRLITPLNKMLAQFVKENGVVGIVNDGPMAAFSAAAETAYTDTSSVNTGVLAYTLGTELGTGYLDGEGKIPDIPLEVYNFIIDLGSWPEKEFSSDDVRSINNFNTKLAGTLQKYTSQSGAFRLALKYFETAKPALYRQLFEKNFLYEKKEDAKSQGLYTPTSPKDMRKPFLEHLMSLAATGGNEEAERIFCEIGEYLAVAFCETQRILESSANKAILFGRLVKQENCFKLLCRGAQKRIAANGFEAADDEMAATPLMRQLKDSGTYTIAQFAQAIGAIHYASYRKNVI